MEINRLNSDELGYEVECRGLPRGTVEEMRKLLRGSLARERRGSVVLAEEYPFSFADDRAAIISKTEEITELISAFVGSDKSPDYKKIVTKIEWALGRVERSRPETADDAGEKIKFRGKLTTALSDLEDKVTVEETGGMETNRVIATGATSSVVHVEAPSPPIQIYKWDLKFSGESTYSVNAFLERVEELRIARGVSEAQLFKSALDLFTGKALIWYRAYRTRVSDWKSLVEELRREFLPLDYDERLLEEIKRRTQGRDESIGVYVAIMSSLFSRLMTTCTEEQKLRILRRNIAPFYQTQLSLTAVNTVDDLVRLGRSLEAVRSSVEAFAPPPSRRNTSLLEPDLAYAYMETTSPVAAVLSQGEGNRTSCWNCRGTGHGWRQCREARRCFGCGTLGVLKSQCQRCNSVGNDRRTQ